MYCNFNRGQNGFNGPDITWLKHSSVESRILKHSIKCYTLSFKREFREWFVGQNVSIASWAAWTVLKIGGVNVETVLGTVNRCSCSGGPVIDVLIKHLITLTGMLAHHSQWNCKNDLNAGFEFFDCRYIRIYGRKFSKDDHVLLIKLVYDLVAIPELEICLVVKFSNLLSTLLK